MKAGKLTTELKVKTDTERLTELSGSLQKMYAEIKELAKNLELKEEAVLQLLTQRELILINDQLFEIRRKSLIELKQESKS